MNFLVPPSTQDALAQLGIDELECHPDIDGAIVLIGRRGMYVAKFVSGVGRRLADNWPVNALRAIAWTLDQLELPFTARTWPG